MGIDKCRICQNGDIQFFFKAGKYNYIRCNNCNFVFLSNIPSSTYFKKLYSYEDEKGELKKLNPILSFLLNYVLIKKILDIYGNVINILRARSVEKHGLKSKILDVGCGPGDFLKEMAGRNWDVFGLEVGDNLVKISEEKIGKGRVFKGYQIPNLKSRRFNTITLWHVLEHIRNAGDTLSEINSALSNKGILIIEVPNSQSLNLKLFKDYWTLLLPPQHLHFWSLESLTKMLSKYGFKIKKVEYPLDFPFVFFSSIIKKNRYFICTILITLPFSLLFSIYLKIIGKGDIIRIYAEKKYKI